MVAAQRDVSAKSKGVGFHGGFKMKGKAGTLSLSRNITENGMSGVAGIVALGTEDH